jgi:hypothetical protein
MRAKPMRVCSSGGRALLNDECLRKEYSRAAQISEERAECRRSRQHRPGGCRGGSEWLEGYPGQVCADPTVIASLRMATRSGHQCVKHRDAPERAYSEG